MGKEGFLIRRTVLVFSHDLLMAALAWTGAIDEPCDGVDNDCDGELPQCVRSMADGGGYLV